MSSSPIAENLERNMKDGPAQDIPDAANPDDYYQGQNGYSEPRSERDVQRSRSADSVMTGPNSIFMPGLLDEQQKFITAQYRFMHDNDLTAYAAAQRDLIQYQMSVLNGMGVFG